MGMIELDRQFSHAGVDLRMTCGACPEQYDAFIGEDLAGYFRLRHGFFTVQAHGPGGPYVYEAEPNGDGIFEPDERDGHLRAGIDALRAYYGV
jgi:hypothetical protein